MRRYRVGGSILGAMLVAGACAAPPGSGQRFSLTEMAEPEPGQTTAAQRDSIVAQAVADREGPRVTISAAFSNLAGSRRVAANFHVEDDAYVLVGHIDADGALRISFPLKPSDDGFVQGQREYATPDFFAGFSDQYFYRYTTEARYRGVKYDSYDGGIGYVFIIASWRPMHFDHFATDGAWDSFELADEQYLTDPRPAIYELASLLVGDNREAYTVKFARYMDTRRLDDTGDLAYASAFGYGYGYCLGYAPIGFISSPFDVRYAFNPLYQYGTSFSYRGDYYAYNYGSNCYTPVYGGFYGFGYPFGFSPPGFPVRPSRIFDLDGKGRTPFTPKPPPVKLAAEGAAQQGPPGAQQPVDAPQLRQRGLVATDDPSRGSPRHRPNIDVRAPADERSRPSIQEMVSRHPVSTGNGWSHAHMTADPGTIRQGWTQPASQPGTGESRLGDSRVYSRPVPTDRSWSSPSPGATRMSAPSHSGWSSGSPSGGVSHPSGISGSSAGSSHPSPPASSSSSSSSSGGKPPKG